MQIKNISFGADARGELVNGAKKLCEVVGSTLGASGNVVVIEDDGYVGGMAVTKDGVSVSRSVNLEGLEGLGCRLLKAASEKTVMDAGDGTSTSIVLAGGFIEQGERLITEDVNRVEVLRKFTEMKDKVLDILKGRSIPSEGMLGHVAMISSNNDSAISDLVLGAYKEVDGGYVGVNMGQGVESYYEVTNGFKFDRGYRSNIFVNDRRRDECIMKDVYVLTSDMEITHLSQLESILDEVVPKGLKLLIIAPCSVPVLNTLAANVMKGNLKCCVVSPPMSGFRQQEVMEDIALSVGSLYVSEKTGEDMSRLTLKDLGKVEKVIVGANNTVLVGGNKDIEKVNNRISELEENVNLLKNKGEKEYVSSRIGNLKGRIGVIYVGGFTEMEQKELYDRVDDSVCAVRSAMQEGVIWGGGKSLSEITKSELGVDSKESAIASEIMVNGLKKPIITMLSNRGLKYEDVYNGSEAMGCGYDIKTMSYGNLIEMGIIDPFKVVRCAIENSVSVAVTILSANAVVSKK